LGEAHLTSAGNQGQEGQDNQSGLWRTIALDLGGDGIQSLGLDESQVVFDVDGTGYLKQTAWIDGSDAMLVLDKNYNGVVDSGSDLFGNTQIALGLQGLKGLTWVDAAYKELGLPCANDKCWSLAA
jgi:hypothetical protein